MQLQLSLSSSLVCAHARPFKTRASGVDHQGRSTRLSARNLQQWAGRVMPARLHLCASWLLRICERHLVRANLHQPESLFVRVTLTSSDTVRDRRDRPDALRLSGPCSCESESINA
jgi:hypothetical protein